MVTYVLLNQRLFLFITGCISFGSIGTLAGVTEIWTITCIAYERHRAICTSLTKTGRLSSFQINLMILFIWVLGIFVSFLPLTGINKYVSEVGD